MPEICTIITGYNVEEFIAEAVVSVQAQTLRPHRILYIDDGSQDGSVARVRRLGEEIEVFTLPHKNAAAARNACLDRASGDYVAFLDGDDVWDPRKLEKQYACFLEHPDCAAIACQMREFRDSLEAAEQPKPAPLMSALLFRRKIFEEVGRFDESLAVSEDTEWYARMLRCGLQVEYVQEPLVWKRMHDRNLTNQVESVQRSLLDVLHGHIAARRRSE